MRRVFECRWVPPHAEHRNANHPAQWALAGGKGFPRKNNHCETFAIFGSHAIYKMPKSKMSTRIAKNALQGLEARTTRLKARLVEEPVFIEMDGRVKISHFKAMRTLAYSVILTLQEFFAIYYTRLVHV
jgi:hypothetical protein